MNAEFTAVEQPLTIQATEDGELVYDSRDHGAHHLDATAVLVRRACVGGASLTEIATACDLSVDAAEVILARLAANGLVEAKGPAMDRRQMLRKAAALTIGTGAVMSVLAPPASAQLSCRPTNACVPAATPQLCCSGATQSGQGPNGCDGTVLRRCA